MSKKSQDSPTGMWIYYDWVMWPVEAICHDSDGRTVTHYAIPAEKDTVRWIPAGECQLA